MNKLKLIIKFIRWSILKKNIQIFSTEETFVNIIDNNLSIARFGDGEINLMNGKNLVFQESSDDLSDRLKGVLRDIDNNNRCLVCIPYSLRKTSHLTMKSKRFWTIYFSQNFHRIYPFLLCDYRYGDSQISRIYINRKEKKKSKRYFEYWNKLFLDKNILIVEGNDSKFGVGNSLLSNCKSINRIICPSPQTYKYYDKIFNAVLENYLEMDLVLLSLGPTATILSYELSKILNIQVIDSGNLDLEYEWWLNSSKTQTAHPYKYSIEVNATNQNTDNFFDANYASQILLEIKE